MKRLVLIFVSAGNLLAADQLAIPIDPAQMDQVSAALRTAVQDGDAPTVLTQGRRMLELYPNEPLIHASVYRLMSEAAQKAGDATQAAQYKAVAKNLDPSLEGRMNGGQGEVATRGKMDNLAAALQVVAQGVQIYQTVRAQSQPQRPGQPQPQPMQQQYPQQQYPQQVQQQYPQQQQPQQVQQQYPQQQQYMPQQGASVNYPPAPVGDPNYQQNPAAAAPMPGWAPQPQYPQQQFQQPPQQQYSQQQPQQQPQYAQPQQPIQGGGPYSPPAQQQTAYPYPSGPAPYSGNGYAPPGGATRGEKPPLFKVIHDHSRVGDSAYFQKSCGALLSVSGSNLTFTPSGGEASLVIPATDILEIRMNTLVGRDAGEFHVGTRQGLYLSVVPASQDRDEARAAVDALRAKLGLE